MSAWVASSTEETNSNWTLKFVFNSFAKFESCKIKVSEFEKKSLLINCE